MVSQAFLGRTFGWFIERMESIFRVTTLLSEIYAPRRILCDTANEIYRIGFCDASKDGFGTVIYIQSRSPSGESKVSLLCNKSLVLPIVKQLSIPSLELWSGTANNAG